MLVVSEGILLAKGYTCVSILRTFKTVFLVVGMGYHMVMFRVHYRGPTHW
jgi:hypothetical protein